MSDRYYRQGHWVTRPRRRSKSTTGWIALAVIAAMAWFAVQGAKADNASPSDHVAPRTIATPEVAAP
jgi:hypothetical protein